MVDASLSGSGIYAIRNIVNGKVYVGSAGKVRARLIYHKSFLARGKHANQKLQRAWLKYGAKAFVFEVLEAVPDVEKLAEREQHWIDRMNCVKAGYNIRLIAENNRGLKASAETRKRMSASQKGRRHTAETKAKMSASKKGRPIWSDEDRARMRVERVGRKHTPEAIAKIAAASTGRKRSRESVDKATAARLRTLAERGPIPVSQETRRRLSEAHKGRPSKSRKPVVVFGVEYPSIGHAAEAHGRTPCWVKARVAGIPEKCPRTLEA